MFHLFSTLCKKRIIHKFSATFKFHKPVLKYVAVEYQSKKFVRGRTMSNFQVYHYCFLPVISSTFSAFNDFTKFLVLQDILYVTVSMKVQFFWLHQI